MPAKIEVLWRIVHLQNALPFYVMLIACHWKRLHKIGKTETAYFSDSL